MPTGIKTPCRFLYRPSWALLLTGAIFAGGCTTAMVYLARNTPVDQPVAGASFTADHALLLFWGAAALAGLITLLALLIIVCSLVRDSYLTVGGESITVPVGLFFVKEVEVSYADIQYVREVDVDGFATMTLVLPRGKCTIACSKMPSAGDYEALKEYLAHRGTWRQR